MENIKSKNIKPKKNRREKKSISLVLIGLVFFVFPFFVNLSDASSIIRIINVHSTLFTKTLEIYCFILPYIFFLAGIFFSLLGATKEGKLSSYIFRKICTFISDIYKKFNGIPFWLIAVILTLISLFFHGYSFAVSDHNLYIPFIKHLINQDFYKNDFLFTQPQGEFSFFVDLITWILRIFLDFEKVFFVIYILCSILMYFSIANITQIIFKKREIVFLALLLSLVSQNVAGSAISTFDFYTHPRFLAISISLFAISLFLESKYILSSTFLALGFLIHPITVICPVIALFFYLFIKREFKQGFLAVLIFSVISSPLVYKFLITPKENMPFFADSGYIQISTPLSYPFPFLWSFFNWLSFTLFTSIFFYGLQIKKITRGLSEYDKKTSLIVFSALFVFMIGVLFVEILPVTFVIQLQVARNLSFVYWFSVIYLAFIIWTILGERNNFNNVVCVSLILIFLTSNEIRVTALLIFLIYLIYGRYHLSTKWSNRKKVILSALFCLFLTSFIGVLLLVNISQTRIDLPNISKTKNYGLASSWIDVQLWAKDSSDLNSRFLVPPTVYPSFRVYSERSAVLTAHDSAPSIFSYEYAKEINKRNNELKNYDNLTIERLREISLRYTADYIVVKENIQFNEHRVYDNGNYKIYRVN